MIGPRGFDLVMLTILADGWTFETGDTSVAVCASAGSNVDTVANTGSDCRKQVAEWPGEAGFKRACRESILFPVSVGIIQSGRHAARALPCVLLATNMR